MSNDETVYAVGFGGPHGVGKWRRGLEPSVVVDLAPHGKPQSLKLCGTKNLIGVDRASHHLFVIDLITKQTSILATQEKWHQPNDFTVSKAGQFYFTDPVWSQTKKGAIWYWSGKPEQATEMLFEKASFFANGIDLSPDEKWLYFTESMRGQIWRVALVKDLPFKPEIWMSLTPNTVDGIKVDLAGRLWVTRIGLGLVEVYDSTGQLLSAINLQGKEPTNLTFGGKDGRTVAVTLRDTRDIEIFTSDHPGREWSLLQRSDECPLPFAQ